MIDHTILLWASVLLWLEAALCGTKAVKALADEMAASMLFLASAAWGYGYLAASLWP
jgi:hypothetical protein